MSAQDKQLYRDPRPGPRLASAAENHRVRALYLAHLSGQAEAADQAGERDPWGYARAQFAKAWVELARAEGIPGPGEEQRAHAAPGEDPLARHEDAAKTRLRNFGEGTPVLDWMLAGIETVIADRKGLARPASFYAAQRRLPGL